MRIRTPALVTACAALFAIPAACAAQEDQRVPATGDATAPVVACSVVDRARVLPEAVRETSGLVESKAVPGEFWTHNDSGNTPEIFALTGEGRVSKRVQINGAQFEDWEDIEAGPCAEGRCLFIADIGDNDRARRTIDVYSIPETAAASSGTVDAKRLQLRFPDGAQDAEALFILPSGDLYIVTKGRHGPIRLYHHAAASTGDGSGGATLTLVRELMPQPSDENDRVTAATATADGRWVAVRTYRNLYFYPTALLTGGSAVQPGIVDLTPLAEVQGESVAITSDGTVWLTSEAEDKRAQPTWSRLKCTFPAG